MADTKKPRKTRKDKGKKRGKRIKNPQFQRGSIDFKTIGTSQTFGSNLTRLAGVLSSRANQPSMDYQKRLEEDVKKLQEKLQENVKERAIITTPSSQPTPPSQPRPDIQRGQEEVNDPKIQVLNAQLQQREARLRGIRRQEEEATAKAVEATARAVEAETRAQGAKDELRRVTSKVGELEAIGEVLETRVQTLQQEQHALKYQQEQQRIQSIFDKVNSMSVATLKTLTRETGSIIDLRAAALGMEGITKFSIKEKGKKSIFVPEFGELIPQVSEVEQGQEEGGMSQKDRTMAQQQLELIGKKALLQTSELQKQGYKQALEEQEQYYKERLQEMSQSEADTMALIATTTEARIAEVEAEKARLQEAYAGLQGQTRAESLANEERLFRLTRQGEQLQSQLAEEQAAKEAMKSQFQKEVEQGQAYQKEELSRLQRERDDQAAKVARLEEDIRFKKDQIEEFKSTSVSKKEYESEVKLLKKEISRQEAELKDARAQRDKGDKLIIKQQMERAGLEQALVTATTQQQKGQAEEGQAVSEVRRAMGENIRHQRERAEMYGQTVEQMRDQFEEERQALRSKIVQAETQRDLIRQSALQQEEEFNEEAKWSNEVVGMMAEDLAGQQQRAVKSELQLRKKKTALEPLAPLQIPSEIAKPKSPSIREPAPSPRTIQDRLVRVINEIATSPREAPPQEKPDVEQAQEEELARGGGGGRPPLPPRPQVKRTGVRPKPVRKPQEPITEVNQPKQAEELPTEKKEKKTLIPRALRREEQEPIQPTLNPLTEREERMRRVTRDIESEKEYVQKELKRRSQYGDLNDEQYNIYTGFRQIGVGREEAKRMVTTMSTEKAETVLLQLEEEKFKKMQSQAAAEIVRPQVDDTRRAQEETSVDLDLIVRSEGRDLYNAEVQEYNAKKSTMSASEKKLERMRIKALEKEVLQLPRKVKPPETVSFQTPIGVASELQGFGSVSL
jgi:hypothetical protein